MTPISENCCVKGRFGLRRAASRHGRVLSKSGTAACVSEQCFIFLNRIGMKFFASLAVLTAFSVPALAQGVLSPGTYRVVGGCSQTFMKGAKSPPVCDHFVGIDVKDPVKPMFIFPLMNGDQAWFFVTVAPATGSSDRAVYKVEKLYDEALGAEFFYPSGECEITSGPSIRCSVWKDKDRTDLARQVVFSGSGQWVHQK